MSSSKYELVPDHIKNEGKFCLWRYKERDGRRTKIPYQVSGHRADSSNPKTFTSYEEALKHEADYSGLGLGIFGNIIAVDIDHCFTDNELNPMAREIIETLHVYTERSPSGEGIRILGFMKEPYVYDVSKYYINNHNNGLEVYVAGCTNKFVTVTGAQLYNYRDYKDVYIEPDNLKKILDKYMVRPKKVTTRAITDVPGSFLSDEEVFEKASTARNGIKFLTLWNGDNSKANTGNSQQEQDLALCSILAFWCGGDIEQMDRLFRSSGLYRDKWERDDYRKWTLEKAITGCENFYKPDRIYISKGAEYIVENVMEINPATNERYRITDLGFGRLYADVFKDVARYVPERKKWFIYDGARWVPDVGNLIAMELCKELANALLKYCATLPSGLQSTWTECCKQWQKRHRRETFLKEAQSVYPIAMDSFDANKYLFNCSNGTLNLKTMEFKEHNPSDKLTKISPVEYDPYSRNDRWNQFILEVMSNDDEKADFLQRSLGYGITGDTRHECMFFLYGETTRNGKGTLMESILQVMGDYGRATRPETIAQKNTTNSQSPSEDIARLAGIRLANISEPSRGLLLNTAQVKSMTGNDTINARFLNENSFDFKPQFKLYVNTNYLPVINDMTLFSSGRIIIIPFERHFEENEQDKSLKSEFSTPECQSAILNWLIEGFSRLQVDGLAQPDCVKEAIKEYAYESNKVEQFMDEVMIKGTADDKVAISQVYINYSDWCSRNGYYTESKRNFTQELRKTKRVDRNRPSEGGNKTTILVGYRLPSYADEQLLA